MDDATIMRWIVYKDGLGKIISGVQKAPQALTGGSSDAEKAAHAPETSDFEPLNENLFTGFNYHRGIPGRIYVLAVLPVLVGQVFSPIGTVEFVNGYGAVKALYTKYRRRL